MPDWISRLRAAHEAATPGPWKFDVAQHFAKNQRIESADVQRMDNGATVATAIITAWKQDRRDARPDARLIAEARNSIPQVLALAEAARNVSLSGVEFDDPRMHYVTVQVTRYDWHALRKALGENE